MILLLGKIWSIVSYTLRKEEMYPKKENLRIRKIDSNFFIQRRTKILWIFNYWEYISYNNNTVSEDIPISFNSFFEAVSFIDEISCN
jgi:hypothetical protein